MSNTPNDLPGIDLNAYIDSDTFKTMLKEEIEAQTRKAIVSSLDYGDLHRAIRDKLNEMLIPAIRSWNPTNYVEIFEQMLNQVYQASIGEATVEMLERLGAAIKPVPNEMSIDDLVDTYAKFVAEYIDTNKLEVLFDDGPHYELIECTATFKEEDDANYFAPWVKHGTLRLSCAQDDYNEFTLDVPFIRGNRRDGDWTIALITNIDFMNADTFTLQLASLARKGTKITGIDECVQWDTEVETDREPEPTDWT